MEFDTQDALGKHCKSEKHVVRPNVFTLFTSLQGQYFVQNTFLSAWKVSVFDVFQVCIFPHTDWIRRDGLTESLFNIQKFIYSAEIFFGSDVFI